MKKKLLGIMMVIIAMGVIACSSEDDISSNSSSGQNQDTTNKEQEIADSDTSNNYTVDELLKMPETPGDEFDYKLNDEGNGIVIRYYKGDSKVVIIPSQIDGIDVVEIKKDAFYSENVDAVVTGKNVSTISTQAFYCCKAKIVVINGPIDTIYSRTFLSSKLESVYIPDTVTVIGDSAFSATNIKEIEIPSGCTYIGESAFRATKLKNVKIPDSCTYIGSNAFSEIDTLETVVMGNGIETIESLAFDKCVNLRKITIPATATNLSRNCITKSDILTIIAPAGSKAEEFAKANDIKFEAQ